MRNRKDYFNTKQVCAYLGISRTTLWRYRKDGYFPKTYKWKTTVYWRKEDIEKWGESLWEVE